MLERIPIFIKVPYLPRNQGSRFTAECTQLRIVSQGRSADEARDRLSEELSLLISAAVKMGTLDDVMTDCGFIREVDFTQPPRIIIDGTGDHPMVDVPVPYAFIAGQHARTGAD